MSLPITRRGVLASGSGLAAVPLLAACGEEAGEVDVPPPPASGTALVATSDVPVQGCAVLAEEKIVVTQPAEGEFKAFSAACTHQGCLVSSSKDGVIPCTCHGSEFSLADGAVLKGPAEAALTEVPVEVRDGVVTATER